MNKKENNRNDWNGFFLDLREYGRYTFTFDDVKKRFVLPEQTISQELYRYAVKKQIIKIRKGFYGMVDSTTECNSALCKFRKKISLGE